MSQLPPCARCKREEPKDYGDLVEGMDGSATLLLREVEFGPGILTWLCHDCRAAWERVVFTNAEFEKYEIIKFKLRHWDDMCRSIGEGELDDGLKLHEEADKQLIVLNQVGRDFLDEDF